MLRVYLVPVVLPRHLVHVAALQPARDDGPLTADQYEDGGTISPEELFVEHETLQKCHQIPNNVRLNIKSY